MSFIFFILIFVLLFGLIIVLGVLNFVFGIFRSIFSFGRRGHSVPRNDGYNEQPTSSKKNKEKIIFDKTDVEDAEYEEIK